MTRKANYDQRLPVWHRRAVYTAFGLLLLSGLAWLGLQHFAQVEGEFGPQPHPLQPLLMTLHGLFSYGFLLVAGALIPVHIRIGWLGHRSRRNGVGLIIVLLALTLSGVAMYYLGGDDARRWTALLHWLVGIIVTFVLAFHVWRGRSTRPAPRIRRRHRSEETKPVAGA